MFGYQIRARKKRLNTTSLRRYSRPGECKGKFDERKVALRFGLVNYYVSLPQNLREWKNITSSWWFQLFFIFTPKIGEDEAILRSIFFKGVGSTTNQTCVYIQHGSNSWMCMSWFEKVVNFMASQPTSMLSTPMRNKALIRPYWGKNYG